MSLEAYEIIFPFNKQHSEICPVCVTEDSEDDPVMFRRSPDVYQCEACGLLILAGYDRFKMSKRVVLGKACDEVTLIIEDEKVKKEKEI